MDGIDYGVYHHSSREESEKLRADARELIFQGLKRIGLDRESGLKILDAGTGSGFLAILLAEHFPNSRITAIDLFDKSSLAGNSIQMLKRNLNLAGVEDRVSIIEADLVDLEIKDEFDLAVSNLVLHNLGRRRFAAYRNIGEALKCDSFFLNADGFIRRSLLEEPIGKEIAKISDIFHAEFTIFPDNGKKNVWWQYALLGLKKLCKD